MGETQDLSYFDMNVCVILGAQHIKIICPPGIFTLQPILEEKKKHPVSEISVVKNIVLMREDRSPFLQ